MTDSKAMNFGLLVSISDSLRLRSSGSLCAKTTFLAMLWRMPSIIEAWFSASDNTTQLGN